MMQERNQIIYELTTKLEIIKPLNTLYWGSDNHPFRNGNDKHKAFEFDEAIFSPYPYFLTESERANVNMSWKEHCQQEFNTNKKTS